MKPETLTPEQVNFEERAAIIEYDGNLSREEAERLAAECPECEQPMNHSLVKT